MNKIAYENVPNVEESINLLKLFSDDSTIDIDDQAKLIGILTCLITYHKAIYNEYPQEDITKAIQDTVVVAYNLGASKKLEKEIT